MVHNFPVLKKEKNYNSRTKCTNSRGRDIHTNDCHGKNKYEQRMRNRSHIQILHTTE